jgi:predicted kinase
MRQFFFGAKFLIINPQISQVTKISQTGARQVLIVMVGFPGTGKSSIARELAAHLDGIILNKDRIREAVFPTSTVDYSTAQDDLCMEFAYKALQYILHRWPNKIVIIDGRTYSKRSQVARLLEIAQGLGVIPCFIECVCDARLIRERLRIDSITGSHPATNRTFDMYCSLQALADPLEVTRLTVDTGLSDLNETVNIALEYLNKQNDQAQNSIPIYSLNTVMESPG